MTTLETLLKHVEELDMKGPLTMDDYADFRTAAPILVEVIRKLVEQRDHFHAVCFADFTEIEENTSKLRKNMVIDAIVAKRLKGEE